MITLHLKEQFWLLANQFVSVFVQSFYSEAEVKQVDLSTTAGSFGILANHVPTLATLRPGLLTVTDEEGVHKYFGEY